jgi:hypothetical protein
MLQVAVVVVGLVLFSLVASLCWVNGAELQGTNLAAAMAAEAQAQVPLHSADGA